MKDVPHQTVRASNRCSVPLPSVGEQCPNKVQDVNDRVRGIDSNVGGVNDNLEQVNRSSLLPFIPTSSH
jgi:hypothetical protein